MYENEKSVIIQFVNIMLYTKMIYMAMAAAGAFAINSASRETDPENDGNYFQSHFCHQCCSTRNQSFHCAFEGNNPDLTKFCLKYFLY